jgi:hypothetical protein
VKTLLSLFDYSGTWSDPFAANGWNVIQWDIKIADFMDINEVDNVDTALDLFDNVDGIIAAPPCTEFTVSCNRLWDMKDADGRTAAALRLVHQTMKLVNLFTPTDPDFDGTFFWGLENPVGRLPKLVPEIGDPWYFNACDYAGWLPGSRKRAKELARIRAKDGKDLTREEFDFVVQANAYTKKTGLWGDFNRDLVKKPIKPVKCAPQGSFTQRFNGGAKGKEERSITPEGFALAFFHANKDYRGKWYDELQEQF